MWENDVLPIKNAPGKPGVCGLHAEILFFANAVASLDEVPTVGCVFFVFFLSVVVSLGDGVQVLMDYDFELYCLVRACYAFSLCSPACSS